MRTRSRASSMTSCSFSLPMTPSGQTRRYLSSVPIVLPVLVTTVYEVSVPVSDAIVFEASEVETEPPSTLELILIFGIMEWFECTELCKLLFSDAVIISTDFLFLTV